MPRALHARGWRDTCCLTDVAVTVLDFTKPELHLLFSTHDHGPFGKLIINLLAFEEYYQIEGYSCENYLH